MSVISLPVEHYIARMVWEQRRVSVTNRGPFGMQTVEASPPQWTVKIDVDKIPDADAGEWKAALMRLKGPTNQLAVYDVQRPAPVGTLRGTLTLGATIAQGDDSMTIRSGLAGAGKTLVPGDLLGFGGGMSQQVVMVVEPVQVEPATYSMLLDFETESYLFGIPGEFTVKFEPPARNAIAAGAPVVWDKPTALFRLQANKLGWNYDGVFASGFSLDLLEDPRP